MMQEREKEREEEREKERKRKRERERERERKREREREREITEVELIVALSNSQYVIFYLRRLIMGLGSDMQINLEPKLSEK